jgi:hypothetical protein
VPQDAGSTRALFIEQDGKPLPLPDLFRWAGARSASNGTWEIANLSPAHYRVCLASPTAPAALAACGEGDLAPFALLEIAPQVH